MTDLLELLKRELAKTNRLCRCGHESGKHDHNGKRPCHTCKCLGYAPSLRLAVSKPLP
jgi:hypothetical protein